MNCVKLVAGPLLILLLTASSVHAGEADLAIPDLTKGHFTIFGQSIRAWDLLFYGALVITGTLGISLYQLAQIHKQPGFQFLEWC